MVRYLLTLRDMPQILHRRITFRTTPHGPILARLPVLHLNGQAFGDLSWYQGEARLLLVLTKRHRPPYLPYPVYDIGVDDASVTSAETTPVRLVKIHHFQENASVMHKLFRVPIRTILLVRHRSREDAEVPIFLPLNHSFPPPIIRFPEPLFHVLLNRPTMTEVKITNAQLPWSGYPPLMTAFRVQLQADVMYGTVLFGLCTSHSTNGKETGSLWATFRGGQSRWECTDYSHQCPEDHVLNWPDLKRRFVVKIHAIHKGLGDHISKWMFELEFTLSSHTGALVLTHIDCRRRVLLKSFGYLELQEEEEGRTERILAPVEADPQYPVSTGRQERNASSSSTKPLEKVHQSAIEAFARRLCPESLFHRLACTPFAHRVPLFPPHWNGRCSEDLSLLLP